MQNKIIHGIAAFVIFAIPVLLSTHAGWTQLTLGGLGNLVYLWASQLLNPTQPVA